MKNSDEIWLDVVGYEGLYKVSNSGRVKSVDRFDAAGRRRKEKILKGGLDGGGYHVVNLFKNSKGKIFLVHRLVMAAFHGPSDLHVDHIDEDKTNNKLSNLRYCTPRQNNTYKCLNMDTTSKYTGVCKVKNKWKSEIIFQGKTYNLGFYNTELEASEAYQTVLNDFSLLKTWKTPYQKNKSSKYKGVTFYKANNKWIAQIKINGKRIYIGSFDYEIDAHYAVQLYTELYK